MHVWVRPSALEVCGVTIHATILILVKVVAEKSNNGVRVRNNTGANKSKDSVSTKQSRAERKSDKVNKPAKQQRMDDELFKQLNGRALSRAVRNEIAVNDAQLRAIRSKQLDAPLQAGGSLLTGTISKVVHQLCNPGKAEMVAFPGRDPAGLVRANFTPFKSIPLVNGRSNIITTPVGKYNVFRTNKGNINVEPLLDTKFKDPVSVLTFKANTVAPESYTTIFGQGNTGTNGVFITSKIGSSFSVELNDNAHPQSLMFEATQEMVGSNVSVTTNFNTYQYQIEESGTTCIAIGNRVAGTNCPAGLPAARFFSLPVGDGLIQTVTNVIFDGFLASSQPRLLKIHWARFMQIAFLNELKPYVVYEDVNTYLAFQTPQIQNLNAGAQNGEGAYIACSTIVTSDASSLNNNGFIYGATIAGVPLINPPYIEFSEWISEQSRWFHKGPLKNGEYQIYIPSEIALISFDDTSSCPWFSEDGLFYSMVFIIDNSFSMNGENPPANTQCHVTWESVYSTAGLGSIIDKVDTVVQPGWEMALTLLRRNYEPCQNEEHIKQMKKWIKHTFNGLQNYAKDIINSPVTDKAIDLLVDRGIPLLEQYGPAAMEAVGSVVSSLL